MTVVGFPLIRSRREPCCRRLSSKSCSDCNKNRMRFIPTSFDPGEGAVGSGAKNHGSSTKIGYTLLAPSTDHPHKWFFKVQQQMASYTWQMGCTWLAPSQLGQNWNELFRVQLHMAFHTWHMGYTWLRWYVHADYSHMKPNSTDFSKVQQRLAFHTWLAPSLRPSTTPRQNSNTFWRIQQHVEFRYITS